MAEKIKMVDVINKKTLLRFKYFWYLVAFLCIIDKVDLADPDRCKVGISNLCINTNY